jgi:hypothetical protein
MDRIRILTQPHATHCRCCPWQSPD